MFMCVVVRCPNYYNLRDGDEMCFESIKSCKMKHELRRLKSKSQGKYTLPCHNDPLT